MIINRVPSIGSREPLYVDEKRLRTGGCVSAELRMYMCMCICTCMYICVCMHIFVYVGSKSLFRQVSLKVRWDFRDSSFNCSFSTSRFTEHPFDITARGF